MRLVGIIRSSTQDIAEGYGPAIQEAELIAYCANNKYELVLTRHITEPATIDLEDRELFKAVLAEAVELKRTGGCDGVVFSRCDRLSRRMESAIQVAIDLRKFRLSIHLVRENQILKPDDQPLSLVMFILQSFGVDTQTRIFLKNTKEGQRKAAEAGKLPSGAGGRGLFGYNLVGPPKQKRFEPNSNIPIVDEVLKCGLAGESINQTTRTLQSRGLQLTRDTVRKILGHARVYAGLYRWGGLEIPNLVPPRITLAEAETIEANMRRNREQSYGWGKRKWLTGRGRCGLCGASILLEIGKHRCHCRRSNRLETLNPCPAPKVAWPKLSQVVWKLMLDNVASPETLKDEFDKARERWQETQSKLKIQIADIQAQINRLEQRRRLLSFQHENGVIGDSELLKRAKDFKVQTQFLNGRLLELKRFASEPPPPDIDLDDWSEHWGYLRNHPDVADSVKDDIANLVNLGFTIHPATEPGSFRIQLTAHIPLPVAQATIKTDGAIVCPSSRRR